MTQLPAPYAPGYSYSAFSQGQGNNDFPGTQLDADLAAIQTAISSITAFLAGAFRADGALGNGTVTRDSLSSGIQLGIAPPTPWAASTAYEVGSSVTYGTGLYACQIAHTSSASFSSDLAAGDWAAVADFSIPGVPPANSVGTSALQDASITSAKLAAGFSINATQIPDGSITTQKLATAIGQIPIGGGIPYDGVDLPTSYLWCDGKAYSRTGTYARLFAALTKSLVGDVTSGSNVIQNVTVDLTAYGSTHFVGSAIEGFGIGAGVTIASYTSTTITLSANATGTASAEAITIFPHGNGDGATTFNVPDKRGRTHVGTDDMGGTAAGRFSGALTMSAAGALGSHGGEVVHTLSTPEMPSHGHTVNDAGHVHGNTQSTHTHGYNHVNVDSAMGGGANYGRANGLVGDTTSAANANITVNAATTGIYLSSTGGGGAHNNLQPSYVGGWIIFAGA